MTNERLYGWNTWDPKGVNRFIHPHLNLEIIIATMDVESHVVLDEYSTNTWLERVALASGAEHLPEESLGSDQEGQVHRKQATAGIPDWQMGWIRRPGPRTIDLARGRMDLEHEKGKGLWGFDVCAKGDSLSVSVQAETTEDDLRFVLIARAPWGETVQHRYDRGTGCIVAQSAYGDYEIKFTGKAQAVCGADHHKQLVGKLADTPAVGDVEAPAIAVIMPFGGFELTIGVRNVPVAKAQRRTNPAQAREELTEAAAAIEAVIGWNVCWDAYYGRLQLPTNKEWVWTGLKGMEIFNRHYSEKELEYAIGPAMFSWDSGFNTLITAHLDCDYAKEVAKSAIMYNRKPDGGFSTCRMGRHQAEAITNPPILTWACGRLYQMTGDQEFIWDVYQDLKNWFYWMKRERDRNGDGLYEWGVNPQQEPFFPPPMGGRLESGLDNSPMYYDIPYNDKLATYEMNCVDLCSFQAIAAEELSKIASAIGREEDAERFRQEYENLKERINERLWDDQRGVYANRLWSGRFSDVITPTSFYPLLAGVCDQQQARRMIDNWIHDEKHFGIEWPLPSVDAAHHSYSPDGNYWRGRVWPPMNYLVYHGLRRYDRAAASKLADKSLKLLLRDWRRHGHVHENYSALTGYGEPTVEKGVCSCGFYAWGGLLGLMALEDIE